MEEMAYSKGIECSAEFTPDALWVANTSVSSEDRTVTAIISLLMSCAAIGFASASTSFDLDISSSLRAAYLGINGLVKEEQRSRSVTFAAGNT